jgi:hypothetical protein
MSFFDWLRPKMKEASPNIPIEKIGISSVIIPNDHILSKDFSMLTSYIERVCIPQIRSGILNYSTIVLSINGYDNDPRSLWDIPEVVSWFKMLFKVHPYIPLLLSPGSVQLYFYILQPLAREIIPKDREYANEKDYKALLLHTLWERNIYFQKVLANDYSRCQYILRKADERVTQAVVNLIHGKEEPI